MKYFYLPILSTKTLSKMSNNEKVYTSNVTNGDYHIHITYHIILHIALIYHIHVSTRRNKKQHCLLYTCFLKQLLFALFFKRRPWFHKYFPLKKVNCFKTGSIEYPLYSLANNIMHHINILATKRQKHILIWRINYGIHIKSMILLPD